MSPASTHRRATAAAPITSSPRRPSSARMRAEFNYQVSGHDNIRGIPANPMSNPFKGMPIFASEIKRSAVTDNGNLADFLHSRLVHQRGTTDALINFPFDSSWFTCRSNFGQPEYDRRRGDEEGKERIKIKSWERRMIVWPVLLLHRQTAKVQLRFLWIIHSDRLLIQSLSSRCSGG